MKRRGVVLAAVLALLLAGCASFTSSDRFEPMAGKGKKKIVEAPTTGETSACTALYSSAGARAVLANAAVDPDLSYGEVGTLILSFNVDDAVEPASNLIADMLGVSRGEGLGVFANLPMLALRAPITRSLVDTLKTRLQPYGLLSIYQDRELQYFLDESADFIGAPAARASFGVTGKGVGVAVIDSGIDTTQGDFAGVVQNIKIIAPLVDVGLSGALYLETPDSDLTSGHGTHVSGTIGGTGAMSDGKYTGIAPGAQLVGIGAGDTLLILYALEGFDYALDPDNMAAYDIRVISNSWGTTGAFAPFNPISIASKRAYDLGVVVNFAAGNEGPGQNTLNPYSASPCVISVAAGDKSGHLADFSSRGIPGDDLVHPDITAPGVDIVAPRSTTGPLTPPYEGDLQYGAYYAQLSGTSMATPHISGVVALMLEANPELNLDGVLDIFYDTARPMYQSTCSADGLNPDPCTSRQLEPWEVGAGYVDAYAAVMQAVLASDGRTSVSTEPLDVWTGAVDPAITDPVLGTPLTAAEDNHALDVPAGVSGLRIRTDWGNPAYDLDLYVYDPSGKLIASSARFVGVTFESVAIPNPVAGSYRVQLKGFLNGSVSYTGTAEVDIMTAAQ